LARADIERASRIFSYRFETFFVIE